MLLLRVAILLVGVHCYIFLTAFIYHYLEQPDKKVETVNHVDQVMERHLLSPDRPKKSKGEIVDEIRQAVGKDKENEIRRAFKSLWKCYLFSLTTITTLGNSGLYLQTPGSRLFFIFTTIIGIALYVCLVHHLGMILLTLFNTSIEYSLKTNFDEGQVIKHRSFARFSVVLLSYFMTFISLFIMGLGALISGNSYLFGIYVIFDSALTVGNFNIIAYAQPWNKIGFTLSVNLILLMGLSAIYTSVYSTFQYARGSDFNELIRYWWDQDSDEGYKIVSQEEERPFTKFMAQSKGEKSPKSKNWRRDKVPGFRPGDDQNPFLNDDDDDNGNPFLNEDEEGNAEGSSVGGMDSMTPAFLSHGRDIHEDNSDTGANLEEVGEKRGNVAENANTAVISNMHVETD